MGLAEELKQSRNKAPQEAPEQAQTDGTEVFNSGLEEKSDAPESGAQEAKQEAVKKPTNSIKIGDREFSSPEEAFQYANDLALASREQEAYVKGYKDAHPRQEQEKQSAPDPIEEFIKTAADKIFEDPENTLREFLKVTKAATARELEQARAQEANLKQTWDNFYSQNPDLAGHRELVEYTMQKHWNEVGYVDLDQGLKLLADKTRGMISGIREEMLPREELVSGRAKTVSSDSGSTTLAQTVSSPENIDFISQIRKLKGRNVTKY